MEVVVTIEVTTGNLRELTSWTVKDPEEQRSLSTNRDCTELEKPTETPQKASSQVALDAKGNFLH